jgi:hypothetical protein
MALTKDGYYYRIKKENIYDGEYQMIPLQKFKNIESKIEFDNDPKSEFSPKFSTMFVVGGKLFIYYLINVYNKDINKSDEDNLMTALYGYIKTFPDYNDMDDLI